MKRFSMMNVMLVLAFLLGALAGPPAAADALARVKLVASTNDLGSIAASVGGDNVEIVGICKAGADPHHVEVLPSYMVRAARARLYLKVGLGLDQWADQIVDGSHNSNLTVVDCSKGVSVLEKPTGKVDASMGDVHPDGNPHYWLDPANGAVVARNIAEALSRVDPANAGTYAANAEAFGKEAAALSARGAQLIGALPSRNILTYHKSWSYLVNAFGLNVVGTVEPVPGIPPTGKHLGELVQIVKAQKVTSLLQEPYFSDDAGKFLAREAGVRPISISGACDDLVAGSYLGHIEAVLTALAGPAPGGAAGAAGK